MRYPPATVNSKRNARLRSMCPDQVPWSMRVKRSWETLSNASAMAEQVVMLVKYSNAMRYIHSGSGIESHLPSESLCLFLCGLPVVRIFCSSQIHGSRVGPVFLWLTAEASPDSTIRSQALWYEWRSGRIKSLVVNHFSNPSLTSTLLWPLLSQTLCGHQRAQGRA